MVHHHEDQRSPSRWSKDAEYKEAYDARGEEFDLAGALIEARTAACLSQSQLARRMKTSQSYIARIEGGKSAALHRRVGALCAGDPYASADRLRARACPLMQPCRECKSTPADRARAQAIWIVSSGRAAVPSLHKGGTTREHLSRIRFEDEESRCPVVILAAIGADLA